MPGLERGSGCGGEQGAGYLGTGNMGVLEVGVWGWQGCWRAGGRGMGHPRVVGDWRWGVAVPKMVGSGGEGIGVPMVLET